MTTSLAHPRDTLGGPPVLAPAPVDGMRGSVIGRRVLVATSEGYLRDLVAVTDPADDPVLGDRVMVVALEDRYWDWTIAGKRGESRSERPRDCRTFPSWTVYVEGGRVL